MEIILALASPLATAIGLIKYKDFLYEIFCKSKYQLRRPLLAHPEK